MPWFHGRCSKLINIKMNLREIGWEGMDWIDLAQDRDQWRALMNNMVMNLRILQRAGNFLNSCTTSVFSKRTRISEVSYCVEENQFFHSNLVNGKQ
jgi:hypothetical protein